LDLVTPTAAMSVARVTAPVPCLANVSYYFGVSSRWKLTYRH
jgi:hypothetical protein